MCSKKIGEYMRLMKKEMKENIEILQDRLEEKDKVITDLLERISNLEYEVERLNKCYCERTDCAGRIKNSAKFESVQEENKRLNKSLEEQRHFYLEKLQQKENIIKEVREKIHDIWFKIDFTNMTSVSYVTIKLDETSQGNELLEILDKEN